MFVERGAVLVKALQSARSRRDFLKAADEFERMLSVVLDCPSTSFTESGYQGLTVLADCAIERIEGRLAARADRPSVQRHLATTIYRVREEIEAIYTRLHTDAAGNPSRNGGAAAVVSPSR